MNKHRNKQRRLSLPEMVILVLAAVVLMAGGVTHAWLKNSQVEVIRDIDKTQQRISDHEDSINSLQVKIDKKLNIVQIDHDLKELGTRLRLIPASSVEIITPHQLPSLANPLHGSSETPSEIAQSHP